MFKISALAMGLLGSLFMLCLLSGCATPTPPAPMAVIPWHDQTFNYDPAVNKVAIDDLFRLDPALQITIQQALPHLVSPDEKLTFLTTLLFGSDGHSFPYAMYHSTVAAETWQRRRGDCLSLTVLAYSIAKTLGLSSSMQQVHIPAIYSRSGRIDFVTGHVNLRMAVRGPIDVASTKSSYVLIDFEPQVGSWERGEDLTEQGILARYYNNVGAESMSGSDPRLAYTYFKLALLADPTYLSSYSNMAQLYSTAGLNQDAEKLLRHALTLDPADYPTLNALGNLLISQGRTAEAAQFSTRLKEKQFEDPYYWLGLGLGYLKEGRPKQSVDVLERAQSLSTGFSEIHHYLAIAYWRIGRQADADIQLSILATTGHETTVLAVLRHKIGQPPPQLTN